MNIQLGLQRVSAVWWGFWGVLSALLFIGGLMPDVSDRGFFFGGGSAGLVACYIGHRVSCWIVAGFFSSRA